MQVFFPLVAAVVLAAPTGVKVSRGPDTVVVRSGLLTLSALLWAPDGPGPFPAVLFNHGSYTKNDTFVPADADAVGPVFARHGYALLYLLRRGVGLSAAQGASGGDLMVEALAARGQQGRNDVQLQLLAGEELNEALAGLAYLRALPQIDPRRLVVVGHSFGGSLALFLTTRDTTIRAAIIFAGGALSWQRSARLRARLRMAVRYAPPTFFVHAENDYSTLPGRMLAAEMQSVHRPQRLAIYPAVGKTRREGHNFVYQNVKAWEADVFAFLDQHLQR